MSHRARHHISPGLFANQFINSLSLPLFQYAGIIFLFSLGDALMTYFSPVYINRYVSNTFVMGLVIAFSSLIGIITDATMGEVFKGKPYGFFLKTAIFGAIAMPLCYLIFPHWIIFFLLAMAAWGIYFENMLFANFYAIHAFVSRENHAFAWGILKTFTAFAYTLGPIIASYLIEIEPVWLLLSTIAIQCFCGLAFYIFSKTHKKPTHHQSIESARKNTFKHELKTWKVLIPVMWPLLLFGLIITMVDASFWDIGSILAESLEDTHPYGGFILTAYVAPSLFMGVFSGFLAKPWGKKRAAFLSGIGAGLLLALAGFVPNITVFIILIFLSSILTAIAVPEYLGTIEDFISRLGKSSSELVSLENSTGSLAYIIGPILAGGIASLVGNQRTFTFMGLLLALASALALFVVPRKIHLPQKDIHSIDQETTNTP